MSCSRRFKGWVGVVGNPAPGVVFLHSLLYLSLCSGVVSVFLVLFGVCCILYTYICFEIGVGVFKWAVF